DPLVTGVQTCALPIYDGEHWSRLGPTMGFHSDAMVRTLVNRPEQPHVIWAGTDRGILRSDDAGRTFRRLDGPPSEHQVWRITFRSEERRVGQGASSRR